MAKRRGKSVEDVTPAAMLRARAAVAVMTQLKVRQVRSGVGGKQNQRDTLRTLGLKRIGDESVREDRPEVRGMIKTVAHLVSRGGGRLTWR